MNTIVMGIVSKPGVGGEEEVTNGLPAAASYQVEMDLLGTVSLF